MSRELPINQIIQGDCLEGGRNVANRRRWQRDNYQKRKSDPEYIRQRKETAKRYFKANRDKCRAKARRYMEQNRDRYRAYRRNYRKSNPVGIFSVLKQGAVRRGIAITFTVDQFVQWWGIQKHKCHYCKRHHDQIVKGADSVNARVSRLTIERLDNTKPYAFDNMRLACYRCNTIKHDYFTEAEMMKIGRIIRAKELAR